MNVLILEDNLKALKVIMTVLEELESELDKIAVTVFSKGTTAEIFLKNFKKLSKISHPDKTFKFQAKNDLEVEAYRDKLRLKRSFAAEI